MIAQLEYELSQLLDVLYKVQNLSPTISSLNPVIDSSRKEILANCEINEEGPKVVDLDVIKTNVTNDVSSIHNYIIPSLIAHIYQIQAQIAMLMQSGEE